jgi:hypothetical protein
MFPLLLIILFSIHIFIFLDLHKINQNNDVFIVLGCANNYLQNDRITTVKNYVNKKFKPTNKYTLLNNNFNWTTNNFNWLNNNFNWTTNNFNWTTNNFNWLNKKIIWTNNKIIWYLSGGIKDKRYSSLSEAELMKKQLKDMPGEFILDMKATNTAENFMNFRKYIDNLKGKNRIYIVTSEFHKTRAEKLFYGFFSNDIKPIWILGSASCVTCEKDELLHMKNVQNDINKAYENNKIIK